MKKRKPKKGKKADLEINLSKDSSPEVRKLIDSLPPLAAEKPPNGSENGAQSPAQHPANPPPVHALDPTVFTPLYDKLEELEKKIHQLGNGANRDREWYTTEQFGDRVGLAKWTVRRRCSEGRLEAVKVDGRGEHGEWRLSHEEVLRYERDRYLD